MSPKRSAVRQTPLWLARWLETAQRLAGLLAILAIVGGAMFSGALRPLDDAFAGLRFRLLGRAVSQAITVVEIDTTSLRAAGRWPWPRDRYAVAIRNLQAAGANLVAFDVDFSAPSSDPADLGLQQAIGAQPGTVVLSTFVQQRSRYGRDTTESAPLSSLAAEALLATVNVPVDPDGKVRRYAYGFASSDGVRPSMGATLAGSTPGRQGAFTLDYGIRIEAVSRLSFDDVYQGRFDPALVRGRTILIGATALELGDEFATPRFGTLPGVLVHALASESLRSGRDLQRLHPLAILLIAGIVVVLLRPRRTAFSLARLLGAHLAVASLAIGLPLVLQAVAPVVIDVTPILLGQVLVLIMAVRVELRGRARAVVEAREAHLLELAQHMRRSRNKIRRANKKLRVANAALDKALQARTEFLASTSHEIRTPLNGILGMTQVILADRRLDPAVREKVDVVHSAGESMLALVDDILDVAKIESGNLVVAPVEMDLHKLLEDAGRLWSAKADEKGVRLLVERGDTPAWIRHDVMRLRQVVSNLLSNAIKFTAAGQIVLRAGLAGDDALVVEVADTGIGIPPDKLVEIFEPFRQVDGSVTRNYGGTGLGLAISRRLAHAMGGELSVESTLGAGSVFRIRLPLNAVSGRTITSASGGGVLLVDANPLTQSVLKAALAPHFGSLEVAGDLEEAAALLRTQAFQLLVADGAVVSQAGSVEGRLAELVARAGGARLVVLWAGPSEMQPKLLAAGADHVAQKPIRTVDLVASLKALCELRPPTPARPEPVSAL
ncbi:CHASE2 domain-containing protein [Phenylobacterium deserti]|uniref:histidine kinase n=1 Tax=Phenylobacterium deserti TaxID=1914756 RepID=A0A328AYQ7_9CAUL|nr:CHASE2 domain-containing protein [Phenylobacterium deserti]RAK57948.1 hypothetical protein DJ018_08580 [Phenylobacterium deserti]